MYQLLEDLDVAEAQTKADPLAAFTQAIAEGGPMPKPSASDLNAVEKQAKTDPLAALAQALPRDASPELPLNKPSNDSVVDEARVRAAAEKAGVTAIVVMRPVHLDKEISSRGYSGPTFGGFIGGNLGPGWGSNLESDTVLVIETLVYALPQNKLVWGGQSKSKNPGNVDSLIEKTADQVADEMERQGLILTKSR
ncbi:hypothetical protein [Rheinheimera sp.]|uniref:hypothetical protein n=1 Tax=Rheinheimera sp. TaxID=1869214 RepID=UPI00307F5E15